MEEIIKVENLCFEYEPGLQTINNISFQIHKGEYVAILGHNGSGKSTIAKLLIGLLEKKSGEIYIDDYQLNLENLYKIREKVGIVFQNPDNQFIGATVRDDIAFGSIGETLKGRKIVISVSPQWFKNTGVKEDAFGATYSESNFIEFLKNKDISDSSKDYVISRAIDLTKNNPTMCNRIKDDVRWYRDNSKNPWDIFRKSIHTRLVEDKADIKLFFNVSPILPTAMA